MTVLLTLNVANYDDHAGWIDRLAFIVDIILGKTNGSAPSPGGEDVPADIVCLSEIRYTKTNQFYKYAAAFWKSQGLDRPSHAKDDMADMVLALLNIAIPKTDWYMATQKAMEYNPNSWEGLSIISRFPLRHTGYFDMPSPNDGNHRITQYATIKISPKVQVTVYNTHFSLDPTDRIANAQAVIDNITQHNPHFWILAGDFNADPTEASIRALSSHYVDLWPEFHGVAENGHTYAAPLPRHRIDYVFTRTSTSARSISIVPPSDPEIGRSSTGTVFASDHLGLWVDF